jgi:toxin ParE1/3/4
VILPVVWLPKAIGELEDAVAWYTNIQPSLGKRFASAVEDALDSIARNPLQFAVIEKGRRRAGIRRFPYGVFFLVEENRIVVIACFHGKRDHIRWQRR